MKISIKFKLVMYILTLRTADEKPRLIKNIGVFSNAVKCLEFILAVRSQKNHEDYYKGSLHYLNVGDLMAFNNIDRDTLKLVDGNNYVIWAEKVHIHD